MIQNCPFLISGEIVSKSDSQGQQVKTRIYETAPPKNNSTITLTLRRPWDQLPSPDILIATVDVCGPGMKNRHKEITLAITLGPAGS